MKRLLCNILNQTLHGSQILGQMCIRDRDYEKRVQDVIEERFNRPDYNSWHKHDRHTGNAYMKSKDGTVEVNTEEAIMFRAADKRCV